MLSVGGRGGGLSGVVCERERYSGGGREKERGLGRGRGREMEVVREREWEGEGSSENERVSEEERDRGQVRDNHDRLHVLRSKSQNNNMSSDDRIFSLSW